MSTPTYRRALQSFISVLRSSLLIALLCGPLAASAANLTGLSLAPLNPTLRVGESVQLTATDNYDDGTQQVIKQVKQISTGPSHTCALLIDSTVQCWGANNSGQLGNGTYADSTTPITPISISGINAAVQVSAGGYYSNKYSSSCAVLADGTVQCWGDNTFGGIIPAGPPGSVSGNSTPVPISGINTAVSVSAGITSCALLADHTLRCWGNNASGQLGNGTSGGYSWSPVIVSGISAAVAVSAGSYHACAVLANGTVQCWGANTYGQLGNGTTNFSTTPVTVIGINNAVSVSTGSSQTCAVLADGTLRCWGKSRNTNSTTPVTVSGISNAVSVSTAGSLSNETTCASLADGAVKCWGTNTYGQLGDGTTTDSGVPVTVSSVNTAVSVSIGNYHSCAVLADATVQCWGNNNQGQLGNGTTSISSTPVSGIDTAVSTSSMCTTLASGTVQCWGFNSYGQLGNGTATDSKTPVTVSGINTAVSVSTGSWARAHNCAALADGTVQCWGLNSDGQLGNGTISAYPYGIYFPVAVAGISTAMSVSAGTRSTCAMLTDGTLRCWGTGALGDGASTSSTTPVTVSGINTAVSVSSGLNHRCAVLADGTLRCWGENTAGQLGNGTYGSYELAPVTVSGINTAVSVSAGSQHTCAALVDGTVKCWGSNFYGQLGIGTYGSNTNSVTPVTVSGINTARMVSSSDKNTCAVLTDATLRCWGDNYYGQLGNGMSGDGAGSSAPVAVTVSGIGAAVSVSTDSTFCALLANGKVQCWGGGQLGSGASYLDYKTPIQTLAYVPLAWSSNNPSVATVTTAGRVSDVGVGTALITASFGGFSGSTTVTGFGTDLSLSLTATPSSVFVGGTVTYAVTVTNIGPSSATGVTVTGTLPACTIGNLASGASAQCTRTVTASAAGMLTQTMTVNSNENDPNSSNNTKSVSTPVTAIADLIPIALTASKSGSKVSVSDTVKNQGSLNVSSAFTVGYYLSTDTGYQAGTDIALASGSKGTGTCTRSVASLNAGASKSGSVTCYKPTAAKNGVNYYVLVVDDAGNVIAESNETNNSKATGSIIRW